MLYQKHVIRKELKQNIIKGIDKEKLTLLKFASADQPFMIKYFGAKEFAHKGEMYDIVEQSSVGDTIYFWCWWDHEETALNQKLDNLLVQCLSNEPIQSNTQVQLEKFFKGLYCSSMIDNSLLPDHISVVMRFISTSYSDINISVLKGPPKYS